MGRVKKRIKKRREDKKNWIAGAVKRPGAFRRKAKRARMSTSAYARHVLKKGSKTSTRTKRQASLALTFAGMRKKKKTKTA